MKKSSIDKIMDIVWHQITNKKDIDELKSIIHKIEFDNKITLSNNVFDAMVERLKWEFNYFKKSPKRTMFFAGIYNSNIYLRCKKCDLIMTAKKVKRPFIESPICPDCNNTFLYTFDVYREGDLMHRRLYNSMLMRSNWSHMKTKIKYNALHFFFCIMEKLKK